MNCNRIQTHNDSGSSDSSHFSPSLLPSLNKFPLAPQRPSVITEQKSAITINDTIIVSSETTSESLSCSEIPFELLQNEQEGSTVDLLRQHRRPVKGKEMVLL